MAPRWMSQVTSEATPGPEVYLLTCCAASQESSWYLLTCCAASEELCTYLLVSFLCGAILLFGFERNPGLHSKPSTYFAPHRKPLICCICTYLLLLFLARNRFGYLLTYAEIRFFRASDLLTYLSAQRSRRCSGTYLLFPELVFAYPQLVATIYQRTYAAANDL